MDSPSSSICSYHTAPSMAIDSSNESPPHVSRYRPVVPVSHDIANLCHIYFDEKLYQSALSIVSGLANSGSSHPNSLTVPALTPLPIHIEAISILLVHPAFTTQVPQNERVELASRSISVLRSILSNLGPTNANLAEAFSFTPPVSRSRRRYGEDTSSDEEEETAKLNGIIMNKGRLRACATDFWHVVGWALNCSVVHRKRWKYWKVWLDFMLDVLDADWKEREAQDEANDPSGESYQMRKNSLCVKYLSDSKRKSSALKRVVGSIFVDGGSEDLRAYPEIFVNETLELKPQNGHKRKREDDFGEFTDEDNDLELDSEAPPPSQETDDEIWIAGVPDPWIGGPESIKLRQRLLALLSSAAHYLPEEFVSLSDLYDVYCNNLKVLPLPAFSLIMSPSPSSQLPTVVFVSLSQIYMLRNLPNSAPRPQSVTRRNDDSLSQDILEKCFLPFAATTSATDDNAKISILAESMLRVYWKHYRVYHTPDLDVAIETGIKARELKCRNDKRRKDSGARMREEEDDRKWLTASGRRLRSMLNYIEQAVHSDES